PETTDSPQNQARHYKVLQELYKSRARPNKKDVAQLLDLEYQARRAYIDSDVMKEQDRPTKILQAYPCFREVDHIMDELQQILNQGNSHFIPELKNRWGTFCEKIQFYGVFKKVMRPPLADKGN
uniref:Si:ch211-208g1.1 n=1 Tax=Labrus bergylta TaxID=56723 RepID=A0A3Q3EFS4_9LABR